MKITSIEADWIQKNLGEIGFFKVLDPQQVSDVIEHITPRTFLGNQYVIREGEKGTSFFLIYNGRVSVSIELHGKRAKLASLNRGEYFGEISLMTGIPTTANVMALAPTKVFFLDGPQFVALVRSNPQLSSEVINVMKTRLRQREKSIEALNYGNVNELNQALDTFLKKENPPASETGAKSTPPSEKAP